MKKSILSLSYFILTVPLSSFAADQAKPMQGMGMMGGGMMMSMSDEQLEQHLKSMQAHMLSMHDLANKILAESDPKKKQELKNQQLELMKAHHKKMMAKHASKMSKHHKMKKQ